MILDLRLLLGWSNEDKWVKYQRNAGHEVLKNVMVMVEVSNKFWPLVYNFWKMSFSYLNNKKKVSINIHSLTGELALNAALGLAVSKYIHKILRGIQQ